MDSFFQLIKLVFFTINLKYLTKTIPLRVKLSDGLVKPYFFLGNKSKIYKISPKFVKNQIIKIFDDNFTLKKQKNPSFITKGFFKNHFLEILSKYINTTMLFNFFIVKTSCFYEVEICSSWHFSSMTC